MLKFNQHLSIRHYKVLKDARNNLENFHLPAGTERETTCWKHRVINKSLEDSFQSDYLTNCGGRGRERLDQSFKFFYLLWWFYCTSLMREPLNPTDFYIAVVYIYACFFIYYKTWKLLQIMWVCALVVFIITTPRLFLITFQCYQFSSLKEIQIFNFLIVVTPILASY